MRVKRAKNPWVEYIPEDWIECHLRRYTRLVTGGTPDKKRRDYWDGGTIPWLASGEVNKKRIEAADAYITEAGLKGSSARWLPAGSVVMALAGQGKTKATVATLEVPATCNQSLAALIPRRDSLEYRFLFYYLDSQYRNIRGLVGDQRDGLSLTHIAGIWMPLPPLPTQKAIANFLDRKTAAIDALIEKKEKLLELLAEKRSALINEAVTKGLDPNVPMKNSGIPWIGEIPEQWEVKRLKSCLAQRNDAIRVGPFGSSLRSSDMLGTHTKVFNQRTVLDRDFTSGENFVSESKSHELSSFLTEPGDILLTTRGTIGRVALVPQGTPPGIIHPCLMAIRVDKRLVSATWVEQLLSSPLSLSQLTYLSNATTIEVIYSYNLREIWLPIPPLPEQAEILAAIEKVRAKYELLLQNVGDSVKRLAEYRQSLITAAVTGQLEIPTEDYE